EPCRVTGDDCPGRDVPRHDRPRSNNGALADRDAPEQHRPGTDRGTAFHQRRNHPPVPLRLQPTAVRRGAGVEVVDEADVVPHEHLVLDRHTFTDEAVALDLAARPDLRPLLNLHERADRRLVADLAAVQVDERVDAHVPPQLDVRGDPPQQTVALFRTPLSHQRDNAAGAPLTGTATPCWIDCCAASRIRTTRHPAMPSDTSGSWPLTARTTFSTSTARPSRVSSCGACMSPDR